MQKEMLLTRVAETPLECCDVWCDPSPDQGEVECT
jgi:hypothetical protein